MASLIRGSPSSGIRGRLEMRTGRGPAPGGGGRARDLGEGRGGDRVAQGRHQVGPLARERRTAGQGEGRGERAKGERVRFPVPGRLDHRALRFEWLATANDKQSSYKKSRRV